MVFLPTGFVAIIHGPYSINYQTQIFIQVLPFMFTAMCIITMLKHKTKIYYGFQGKEAPQITFFVLQLFTIVGCLILATITID